jgi:phage shock protein PspC (stress-responsive transcriptional regulator)
MAVGLVRGKAGIMNIAPDTDQASTAERAQHPQDQPRPRQLARPLDDRMLAGVASGLARYLGLDVLPVRIALVVLCFVGGIGLPLYLAGWLLIPDEGAQHSIADDLIHSVQSGSN